MLKKKAIIWDWNGTLLDDLEVCVEIINLILKKRNLPQITRSYYRKVFTFPVINYYKKIGFDFKKEEFRIIATEFIKLYYKKSDSCYLFSDVIALLEYFKKKNINQYILSAMKESFLKTSIKKRNIEKFFKKIIGINDHYAKTKIESGRELLKAINLNPQDIYLIGDTIHDSEVALELGFNVVLIANGHQSFKRLKKTNQIVLKELKEVIKIF